ncbi:MAG TPA: hypothetical protein VGC97_04235 [Pyrinomonadaceae bacterium]|jgi:hypothetical protein
MEFEFDKEMDAILRQARLSGEVVTSAGTHLDADEISAFAENSVSGAARARFTAHFAECTRCRKILSNVILMNAEAEPETASSAVAQAAAEPSVPWYRRLFIFPQLAYAMGALVLLFSGFFAYLLVNNLTGSREVSYTANTQSQRTDAATTQAPSAVSNTSSSSNSTATNSLVSSAPANVSTTTTTNSAPVSASNTNAFKPSLNDKTAEPDTDGREAASQPVATPDSKPQIQQNREADRDDLAKVSPASPTAGATSQNRSVSEEKQQKNEISGALRSKDDNKKLPSPAEDSESIVAAPQKTAKRKESEPGATRSVGGKTFNNVGGIWFDSAVGKQKQKTVNRGTSEFLRLDAGLRSIADQLGGTVVVLWNGKAYRIQ